MKYDDIEISRQLETVVPVYVPDMSTPIGRLKHLRHVVEGVPDVLFRMACVAKKTECGTVGCMIGHAAMDPTFNAMGLTLGDDLVKEGDDTGSLSVRGFGRGGYSCSGAHFFGISSDQAHDLFFSFPHYNEPYAILTKAHGIARIDRLIAELSA